MVRQQDGQEDRLTLEDLHEFEITKESTFKLLKLAESLYLKAWGWTEVEPGKWKPPKDHLRATADVYDQNHAVNSTKYHMEPETVLARGEREMSGEGKKREWRGRRR
jgi:hypothetical protein